MAGAVIAGARRCMLAAVSLVGVCAPPLLAQAATGELPMATPSVFQDDLHRQADRLGIFAEGGSGWAKRVLNPQTGKLKRFAKPLAKDFQTISKLVLAGEPGEGWATQRAGRRIAAATLSDLYLAEAPGTRCKLIAWVVADHPFPAAALAAAFERQAEAVRIGERLRAAAPGARLADHSLIACPERGDRWTVSRWYHRRLGDGRIQGMRIGVTETGAPLMLRPAFTLPAGRTAPRAYERLTFRPFDGWDPTLGLSARPMADGPDDWIAGILDRPVTLTGPDGAVTASLRRGGAASGVDASGAALSGRWSAVGRGRVCVSWRSGVSSCAAYAPAAAVAR